MLRLHCYHGNHNLHIHTSHLVVLWYRQWQNEMFVKHTSLFLCDFGKNGAESCHKSHTVKNLYVLIFFLLTFCSWSILCLILTLYLCLCSSYSTLSQAPDLQGILSLPHSQAQQGLTPLGSDPHTHLAPYIHSYILSISQVLSPLSPSSTLLFLLCVQCVMMINRMSILSLVPPFFIVWVFLLCASLCLWLGW